MLVGASTMKAVGGLESRDTEVMGYHVVLSTYDVILILPMWYLVMHHITVLASSSDILQPVLHYWIEHACGVLARSRCEASPHLRKYHPIEIVRLNAQLSMVSVRSEACPLSSKQVNSFDAGIRTARSLVLAISEPNWTSAIFAPAECLGGSYHPISTLAKSR